MPVQIFGTDAIVTTLNRAFNDQSPAYAVYNNQVAQAASVGANAFALSFGSGFTTLTEDQLSTKLLTNLGVLPNAALQTALKDYLIQVGKANVGIVALQLGQILSGLENATGDQAGFAVAAVAWNNEVTASYTYSANPASTSASPQGSTDTAVTGVTLSLSSGDDFISPAASEAKFKTTANNDTILASTSGFLGSSDVIDAGAGVDSLKATLTAAGADAPGGGVGTPGAGFTMAPTLNNVEKVYIKANVSGGAGNAGAGDDGGAGGNIIVNAAGFTGTTELWSDGSTAAAGKAGIAGLGGAAGSITFSGIKLGTQVGVTGSSASATFDFAGASGAADAATVALASATGGATLTVGSIENLTVNSASGTNNVVIAANLTEKVTIMGVGALTATVTAANATVIDASALTKALGLTFTTTGTTAVAITGGVGADTFNITGTLDAKITLVAGDGADTVNINAQAANKITLGAGADTLNITGLAGVGAKDLDISTASKLAASAVEVTDFVSGTDVLNLTSGFGKAAPTGTQLANFAASSTLLTAAELAATTAGASKAIAFQYGADTYILVNDAAGALSVNDSLIKLTGVATLSGASWTSV
ncbi:hypothetical protein PMI14_03961 [Acidovorax sp. CF316]|uniref:bluetail domain-containing putative surface protein n=1 Tax=Acidovorax sp. CF316 TaxID=1144317 RepID=UPI00026BC379|nr:bluetail domain-containing putative surface protein [Acidovorax sp. CF316]EJE51368.1 hypothetical protein PMI14_03961 [Acidovorax sp. CF316]